MEFEYIEEVTPFTEEDWQKCMKVFGQCHFRNEMYGDWLVETEQERKLRELAETYHTGCEAYDKRVCSGTSPRTGEAMPLTHDEMRLINRHAREMHDSAIAEGWQLGFTHAQVNEAIRKWVK